MTASRRPLAAGAVTVVLLAGALVAAGAASAAAAAALLAAAAAVEVIALDDDRRLRRLRVRIGAGATTTAALQGLALVLLAARTSATAQLCGAAAVAVIVVAATVLTSALDVVVRRERRPPVLTRNVALDVAVARFPERVTTLRAAAPFAPAVAAAGFAIAATGTAAAFDLALATVVGCAPVVPLAVHAGRLRARRTREAVTSAAVDAFAALRPRLLLYFASTPAEVYQLDMWLGPVEQAGVPAAVVVRDHEALEAVGATSLPVFCVRHNGTMAALELADPVVALFVTHSGNNLSLLRRAEVRSVFVGHGDSDKPDSMNAFARVYDEVWVAGPVGRRRYATADVGVRPAAVVEVGRPQLPVEWPAPPEPFSVLYAPTWEGWGDDPHHTSLPHVGVAVVQQLLAAGVRVLYRPHPLTGVRNGDVRRAHDEVLALLRGAGAQEPATAVARAAPSAADPLAVALATGRRPGRSRSEWEAAGDTWARALFAAAPQRSLVLDHDPPTLHQTFRAAHVLVTDVSSVASDWLATMRPYAMVDTRGLGADEFRRRFPVAAAALVVDGGLGGLDVLWRDQRTPHPPSTAMTLTRAEVLGPADSPAAFRAAVRDLLARPDRQPRAPGAA